MKNNPVCKENASNVFRKEREQYHEIQDMKAQMQDKNMVINELKKLILVTKGKSVETQFDKPSVVRQPNAQRIPKPSVLGKPTPFSNSPEMRIQTPENFECNAFVQKCGKCVFNSYHDAFVSRYFKDVMLELRSLNEVPISASKPKRKANKSVATPHKKTVASDTTIQKSKSYYKKLYEDTNQEWEMVDSKRLPIRLWMHEAHDGQSQAFVEKFLGTVHFGNDQFAPILGYGDLIQGNVMIKRVYYVEGLNHNLFSVGQFCDADLEVAFRKSTCFVRDLQGNDLLTSSRGFDLYTISLREKTSSTPICFMAKSSIKHLHIFGCINYRLSSNSRTSNENVVCAECGTCVFNSNHDACVSRYLKDVNARTNKPNVVPIHASKPKRKANKSVATPHKKTVASDTAIQKSKSYYKELYENTNKEYKWWIAKRCPSGYTWTQKPLRTKKIWMPKIRKDDESTSISPTIDIVSRITNVLKISMFHRPLILLQIVQLILFIVDSGCTKHMTGNLKLLCNFVEKFLGTVHFGNDQFAPILGYGDLI
ncbi:hypothetical protein Tco_0199622 [Tanacetum coccineum]